eukprot:TRINITY_DN28149_c0_g1_i2.p1 TRINITY_DN28149_c0_g1~~TRINITY_DN28149_c0_g1_i2.p1  ORF type:complete len:382 (+),score=70.00 TRINITY_DN28149_c0_g1_i2:125-1270(+)
MAKKPLGWSSYLSAAFAFVFGAACWIGFRRATSSDPSRATELRASAVRQNGDPASAVLAAARRDAALAAEPSFLGSFFVSQEEEVTPTPPTTPPPPVSDDDAFAPSGRPGVGYMELVVAWFCEEDKWFRDYRGAVAVYIKKPSCVQKLKESLALRPKDAGPVIVRGLPNVGREGHSYAQHIVDNYDTLAPYTAFTQGSGMHNGAYAVEHIREFLKRGENARETLIPITPKNRKGFNAMYRDADQGDKEGMDEQNNVLVFPHFKHLKMADRARSIYATYFGGKPCDMPPMVFIAGAQMIVRREAIRSKPKEFWIHLRDTLADCFAYGWDWERMWTFAFDLNLTASKRTKRPPIACGGVKEWKTWNCKTYKHQEGQWRIPQLP